MTMSLSINRPKNLKTYLEFLLHIWKKDQVYVTFSSLCMFSGVYWNPAKEAIFLDKVPKSVYSYSW